MTEMILKSHAKINLALDILRRDEMSGYHEIRTVFHRLSEPFDELIFEKQTAAIDVRSDNPKLPCDKTNTVLKAALLLKKREGIADGAKIYIKKKIPLFSGLGGGAANAVAALKGLAKLWGVNCCETPDTHADSKCILKKLADQIGMDCAFFFLDGAALGEHFGEKISPLPSAPSTIKFEIFNTGVEVSSRSAYRLTDLKCCGKKRKQTDDLIAALKTHDAEGVVRNAHNDFEEFIFEAYPRLAELKKEIEQNKSGKVLLCGSGGALARIYFGETCGSPTSSPRCARTRPPPLVSLGLAKPDPRSSRGEVVVRKPQAFKPGDEAQKKEIYERSPGL